MKSKTKGNIITAIDILIFILVIVVIFAISSQNVVW